jgi:glucose-6-phosphate isomerase
MSDVPFTFTLPFPALIPTHFDGHIQRRLSSLGGQFLDQAAYDQMIALEDCLVYEVYEIHRPEVAGEILSGISIVHPGQVGREFFMTKGHFHTVRDTAEIYMCLKGEGCMVMETPQGETCVEMLSPGTVLYVPPFWAHRSVCTSRQQDLVTFFAYPGHAGHDYGAIERQGFGRLVLEAQNGQVEVVDNPRWNKPS